MPNEYDALLDAPPSTTSEYDALLSAPSQYDKLLEADPGTTSATEAAVKETSLFSRAVKGVGQAVGKMAEEFAPLAVGDVTPLVNMVVPNKQDIQAFTPSALSQRTKIGSPEYFEQVTNYAVPVATLGVPLLRGKAGEIPRGGEIPDASTQPSATGAPEQQVRTQVGEEAPLRQQGEAPQAQPQEEVAQPIEEVIPSEDQRSKTSGQGQRGETGPPKEETKGGVLAEETAAAEPAAAAAPVGGANVKAFERIYGPDEIPSHGSVSPEEEWAAAEQRAASGKAQPYGFVDRARTGAITPDEMGDLIYEHQRLVTEAANAEGTPQYEELYNRARSYAENVVKPAENAAFHRTGMVMQIKPPVDYTRLTGFRAQLEKRMGREMTPEEAPAFKKIADEVNGARNARNQAASQAMGKVMNRMKSVRDISFEDAVKQVHDSLSDAAKPCKI